MNPLWLVFLVFVSNASSSPRHGHKDTLTCADSNRSGAQGEQCHGLYRRSFELGLSQNALVSSRGAWITQTPCKDDRFQGTCLTNGPVFQWRNNDGNSNASDTSFLLSVTLTPFVTVSPNALSATGSFLTAISLPNSGIISNATANEQECDVSASIVIVVQGSNLVQTSDETYRCTNKICNLRFSGNFSDISDSESPFTADSLQPPYNGRASARHPLSSQLVWCSSEGILANVTFNLTAIRGSTLAVKLVIAGAQGPLRPNAWTVGDLVINECLSDDDEDANSTVTVLPDKLNTLNTTAFGVMFSGEISPNHMLFLNTEDGGTEPLLALTFESISEIDSELSLVRRVDITDLKFGVAQYDTTVAFSALIPLSTNATSEPLLIVTIRIFNESQWQPFGDVTYQLEQDTATVNIRIDQLSVSITEWPFLDPQNLLQVTLSTNSPSAPANMSKTSQIYTTMDNEQEYMLHVTARDYAVVDEVNTVNVFVNFSTGFVSFTMVPFDRSATVQLASQLTAQDPAPAAGAGNEATRIVLVVLSFVFFGITLVVSFVTLVQHRYKGQKRRQRRRHQQLHGTPTTLTNGHSINQSQQKFHPLHYDRDYDESNAFVGIN